MKSRRPKNPHFDFEFIKDGRKLFKTFLFDFAFAESRNNVTETMSGKTPPRGRGLDRGRDRGRRGRGASGHGSDRSRSSRSSLEGTPDRQTVRSTVHVVERADEPPETPQRQQELEQVREEIRQEHHARRCLFLDELREMNPLDMMQAYGQARDSVLSDRKDYGTAPPHDRRSQAERRTSKNRAKNRDIRRLGMLGSETDVTIVMADCHPFLLRRWMDYVAAHPSQSLRVPPIPRDEQQFANQLFYQRLHDYTEATLGVSGVDDTAARRDKSGVTPTSGAKTPLLAMLMRDHPRAEEADLRRYLDIKRQQDQLQERDRTIYELRQKLNEERELRLQVEQERRDEQPLGLGPLMLDVAVQTHLSASSVNPSQSVGWGDPTSEVANELRRLIAAINVPLVTTPRGRGQRFVTGPPTRPPTLHRQALTASAGPTSTGIRQMRPLSAYSSPATSPEPEAMEVERPSAASSAQRTVVMRDTPSPLSGRETPLEERTAPTQDAPMAITSSTGQTTDKAPRLARDDPRRVTMDSRGRPIVVITHSEEEEMEQEEAEAEEERLFQKTLRTGVLQTPANQPYQGPRRRRSRSARSAPKIELPKEEPRLDVRVETAKRVAVESKEIETNETVVMFADPVEIDTFLTENEVARKCPDAVDGRVMYSVPAATKKIPSHCNYPMCAIRNPGFTYEEHENAEAKFMTWKLSDVQERATMSAGVFSMIRRRKMITVNYGFHGCSSWKLVEKKLEELHFFDVIEATGIYSLDLEHWPEADAKRKALTPEEQARAISVITIMNYDGILFQWGFRYDGRNEPVSPVPERLVKLIADSSLFKIGFGLHGDFQRLAICPYFPIISPGIDVGNFVFLMFPQDHKNLEQIKSGKVYAAAKLGAKLIYVKHPPRETCEEQFKVWQVNWNDDLRDWVKPDVMTSYNHFDNRAAWATLMAITARQAQLTFRPDADVLRVAHYLLAAFKGFHNRAEVGAKTGERLRPYPEWYSRDTREVQGAGRVTLPPYLLQYDWTRYNPPSKIISNLKNLRRGYPIDLQGIPRDDVRAIETFTGQPASNLNYSEQFALTLVRDPDTVIYPHVCYRCGVASHDGNDCPANQLLCIYCRNVGHVVKVCPSLHTTCEGCGARGHMEADHRKFDMVAMHNRFQVFKAMGYLTVRLATQQDAVGYVGSPTTGKLEWITRDVARSRYHALMEKQRAEAQAAHDASFAQVVADVEEVLDKKDT